MAYGVDWTTYPWGYSSSQDSITINYTQPVWTSGATATYYNWPMAVQPSPPRQEMPESPMDWLHRRVTEVTDLAYAEI